MRLNVITERQTEEQFVKKVLSKYLNISVNARSVLTSTDQGKHRPNRGGLAKYHQVKSDIEKWLKQESRKDCIFTSMFDLYRLPNDFPGFQDVQSVMDPYQRIQRLEDEFYNDVADKRFIPYIQLHEFEALLFVNIRDLQSVYIEHFHQISRLERIKESFQGNPELIDDGPTTAPSKRILQEIPEYKKVIGGTLVAQRIGIQNMRNQCQHFNRWLAKIEEKKHSFSSMSSTNHQV